MLDTNLFLPILHLVIETVDSLGELAMRKETLMSRAESLQMRRQKKTAWQSLNHFPYISLLQGRALAM